MVVGVVVVYSPTNHLSRTELGRLEVERPHPELIGGDSVDPFVPRDLYEDRVARFDARLLLLDRPRCRTPAAARAACDSARQGLAWEDGSEVKLEANVGSSGEYASSGVQVTLRS